MAVNSQLHIPAVLRSGK